MKGGKKKSKRERRLTDLVLQVLDLQAGLGLLILEVPELVQEFEVGLCLLVLDFDEIVKEIVAGLGLRVLGDHALVKNLAAGLGLLVLGSHELRENLGLLGLDRLEVKLEAAQRVADAQDHEERQGGHENVTGISHCCIELADVVVERSNVLGYVTFYELHLEGGWMARRWSAFS